MRPPQTLLYWCLLLAKPQTDAWRYSKHSDVICDNALQCNMSKSLMWQFYVPLRLHSPSLRVTLAILIWAGLHRMGAFTFFFLLKRDLPFSFGRSYMIVPHHVWCCGLNQREDGKTVRVWCWSGQESQMLPKCSNKNEIKPCWIEALYGKAL